MFYILIILLMFVVMAFLVVVIDSVIVVTGIIVVTVIGSEILFTWELTARFKILPTALTTTTLKTVGRHAWERPCFGWMPHQTCLLMTPGNWAKRRTNRSILCVSAAHVGARFPRLGAA